MKNSNEKGSITLFTLVAMVFFLGIAFTAYASAMTKLQSQNEGIEQIRASYEKDLTEEGLSKLYNELTGTRKWLPGEGTQQNPYKIYTIEDFVVLSNQVNVGEGFSGKYIELMSDLDFTNVKSYEKANRVDFQDVNNNSTIEELKIELTTGSGWQPVGNADNPFSGKFNGNGHILKNLYINTNQEYSGLFGTVQNGEIKNLGIETSTCQSSANYSAMIAGTLINSKIDSCYNKGTVIGKKGSGGIVAQVQNQSIVSNCYNSGNISSSNEQFAGGIAGYNSGTIRNCYNSGTINESGNEAGGIVGGNSNIITKTYNVGTIEASTCGGIAGQLWSAGSISNSYNSGQMVGALKGGIVYIIHEDLGQTLSANYYLYTTADYGIAQSTKVAISAPSNYETTPSIATDMPTVLSVINGENAFVNNPNDSYPILEWELQD